MRELAPATPATTEAAAWWVDELHAALPLGTPAEDVEPIVRRQAARISHVVLAVACGIAGVPHELVNGGAVPSAGRLIRRLAATELRRLTPRDTP